MFEHHSDSTPIRALGERFDRWEFARQLEDRGWESLRRSAALTFAVRTALRLRHWGIFRNAQRELYIALVAAVEELTQRVTDLGAFAEGEAPSMAPIHKNFSRWDSTRKREDHRLKRMHITPLLTLLARTILRLRHWGAERNAQRQFYKALQQQLASLHAAVEPLEPSYDVEPYLKAAGPAPQTPFQIWDSMRASEDSRLKTLHKTPVLTMIARTLMRLRQWGSLRNAERQLYRHFIGEMQRFDGRLKAINVTAAQAQPMLYAPA